MTASSTMCNAGSPPYGAVFLISAQSIKVSMKKKRKEREQDLGGGGQKYIGELFMACARVQLRKNAEVRRAARALGGDEHGLRVCIQG